jgi:hypothetical protein
MSVAEAEADVIKLLLSRSGAALATPDAAAHAAAHVGDAFASLRASLPYARRLQLLSAATVLQVALLAAARGARPGWARAPAAAIVVAANLLLPLLFLNEGELLSRVSTSFAWAWIGSFKVCHAASRRTARARLQPRRGPAAALAPRAR